MSEKDECPNTDLHICAVPAAAKRVRVMRVGQGRRETGGMHDRPER